MTALNKQALREAAEKAISEEGETWWNEEQLASDYGLALHRADAKFIAAANPSAVLELLDDLESAENNLIDSECHVAELEESLRDKQALLEAAEECYEDMLRQARSFREAHDYAAEIIRKLERNKPTVTLPTTRLWAGKVACYEECEIREILRAAGIGVKGE
ncbi:ead/Ea22-like family protein [Citrobacter freundii]|uniref:ead/Ea22-like family protein n=1 Tax=Citrobacter freundii TaxID=546 RepID=UPI001F14D148|nr:ead/Ea22-like family protein [Citrobacter freundii]